MSNNQNNIPKVETKTANTAPAVNQTVKPAVPAEKTYETRPQWPVSVNKFGDLHLKKAMIASMEKFSGLKQGEDLTIEFQTGKLVITKKQ